MPTFHSYKTQEEWLELRSQDITSTESSALFGLSPYVTEFELYHNKVGEQINSFVSTERMKWGNRLESAIAYGVAEDYGLIVEPFKEYVRHIECPRMGSSFDFIVSGIVTDFDGDNEFRQLFLAHGCGILEIKNVDGLIYNRKWQEKEAPDHIEVQVQHQLEVASMHWTMVCPLVGGNEAKPFARLYDPEIGRALREVVTNFWKMIEDGTPPQPNFARDAEFIIQLHQNAGGDVLDATGDEKVESLLKEYDLQGRIEKDADLRRKAIKAELLEYIGDASKVICGNMTLSATMTAETPPKVITTDMVGNEIGGRKGFRNFRLTVRGE